MDESLAPSDLVIDQTDVQTVERWLESAERGHVLVITSESPGCGVSTMLRVLARHMSDRLALLYDEPLGFGTHTVLGHKKVLVLDPLDEFVMDQTKQRRALSMVEERRIPIVITGIRRRVSMARVSDMFGTVAKKEGVTFLHIPTPDRTRALEALAKHGVPNAEQVWDASAYDFRHCLAAASVPNDGPDDTPVSRLRSCIPDGLDALKRLLQSPRPGDTFADAMRMAEGDVNLLIDGVFENYTRGIVDDSSSNFETIHAVLDILSACDHLQHYVFHDPSSEFPEIGAMLGGVQFLSVDIGSANVKKHGTVWAKENHKHTKKKLLRLLTSHGIHPDSIPYIRSIVCTDPSTQAPRLAKAYDPSIVWNATRLWMHRVRGSGYTKARHDALTSSVVPNSIRARRS